MKVVSDAAKLPPSYMLTVYGRQQAFVSDENFSYILTAKMRLS
jgi:hypothetical protein